MITQKAEAACQRMKDSNAIRRAELQGAMSREVGDARDSNSYLEHRMPADQDDPACDAFIAAWWLGWDQADGEAILLGGKLP